MADILVAWRKGEPGQIFFSQVAANLAVVPVDWSDPKQISSSSQATNSPDLLVDRDGKIFVAYAVPANEGRGIYLSYSEDGGQTWVRTSARVRCSSCGLGNGRPTPTSPYR